MMQNKGKRTGGGYSTMNKSYSDKKLIGYVDKQAIIARYKNRKFFNYSGSGKLPKDLIRPGIEPYDCHKPKMIIN